MNKLRVATWNVNSLRVRLPHVQDWLRDSGTDLVALQETKLSDDKFPAAELAESGYRSVFSGQPTYNGVALLVRDTLPEPADIVCDIPGLDDPQRRVLAATCGNLRIVDLYVPNGQALDSDKFVYKMEWLARLRDWLEQELRQHERLLVVGDFNIAPEDRDVHDPEEWRGSIHCSEPEREALAGLQALGLSDLFRCFEQPESSFSWWDYRGAAFRRNRGLRIDLLLASAALQQECVHCSIDREPRTWERPSDHTPVVADFALADDS